MIKNTIKQRLWVLILVFFSLLSVGCSTAEKKAFGALPEESEYVAPDETLLRVGVTTSSAPLVYKHGFNVVGVEADLAREFAKYLGKSVRFVELQWENQIPALLENRIDIIMSGMSVTPMREYKIAFSNSYFRTGQMALIRKGDEYRFYPGYYAILIQKIKIGVIQGTTGESFVRKNFFNSKTIAFNTPHEAVGALLTKKIDVFIHDAPMVLMLASENESRGLMPISSLMTEEYLAWGIRKEDQNLLNSANRFIETVKRNGVLYKIIMRWIPMKKIKKF